MEARTEKLGPISILYVDKLKAEIKMLESTLQKSAQMRAALWQLTSSSYPQNETTQRMADILKYFTQKMEWGE